jgi:endonuclease/exonuclease/phosphatase family metal-dependent hydrolase
MTRRRCFGLLLIMAAIQGCASLGGEQSCAAPEAMAAAGEPSGELRVMSWNVHGMPFDSSVGRRTSNIARAIGAVRPDVVLLEEVWLEAQAERFVCEMRGRYDVVAETAEVRSGPLALFGHRRGGLLALVRRSGPWRLDESLAARFVEYSSSSPWYQLDQLDGIAGKGIQSFAVTDGTRRVVLLHTHLQTPYPARGEAHEEVRRSQLAELLAQARRSSGEVVLIAGDLNVRAEEAGLYNMLAAELDDLTASYRATCAACGTFITREGTDDWWIDHLFVRKDAALAPGARIERIRNSARDEPYSDHHGLWAELRVH